MPGTPGPVVIGGIRGSGTRLVARVVRELGFHLGDDLNAALDNQWFGLLLGGRPEWCRARPDQVPIALRLFEKAMHGSPSLGPQEHALLREAVDEWKGWASRPPRTTSAQEGERWVLGHVERMTRSPGIPGGAPGWGWKSPGSHLFLPQLADAFPEMTYIHITRNSAELVTKVKTRREARAWGQAFGIDPDEGQDTLSPSGTLRYWGGANRRALGLGPELFGRRFLVVRYEAVCADPEGAVASIGEFLGVDPPSGLAGAFAASIQ